jgi:hypothetical protein
MQRFLSDAYGSCEMLDEQTARVGPTLWYYYSPRKDFAAAMQRFQQLIEAEERGIEVEKLAHTDFDMVVLTCLELGDCFVMHGRKILPPGTQQFRNETAQLQRCACGRYRIETTNPRVQRCCL